MIRRFEKELPPMTITNISFIGLGAMGNPMTALLLKAGYHVKGFDIIEERMKRLVPLGLKTSGSPSEATRGADLVMLSLPNWDVVRLVLEAKGGVLEGAREGQIIIDTSTVPPWETKAMGATLARKGIDWMDVPVSGDAARARVGNLVLMAGGRRSVFQQVKPVLDAIGRKVVYVGKQGDAAMLKLVVNQVIFLNQAAAVEGLVLGLKAGLPTDIMLDVLVSGAAGSDLIATRGKDMIEGNFVAKGAVRVAVKDLGLILEWARRLQVMLPMAGLYHQLLLDAEYSGWERSDATVVMRVYEKFSGIRRGTGRHGVPKNNE